LGWPRTPTAEELSKCQEIISEANTDLEGNFPKFLQSLKAWTDLKSVHGSEEGNAENSNSDRDSKNNAASLEIHQEIHAHCLEFQKRYNVMTEKLKDFVTASCQTTEGNETAASNNGKEEELAASNHLPSPSV
jgi:hypothetical protein